MRVLAAFGTGLNFIEDRFLGWDALFLTMIMPHVLLFANMIATIQSWVKMTEMKNVNPAGEN